MALDPLTAGLELGKTLIERWFPDKSEQEKKQFEMLQMAAQGEIQLALGQMEVNKAEAAHASVFVAGWRPAVGWVCALALLWTYIGRPVAVALSGHDIPATDLGDLLILLGGMLGLTTLRTVETLNGVQRNKLK